MFSPAVRTVLLGKAFNPLSIPGLGLWYDAADASTLTYDGSNRVSSWANKSGRANCNATQGTAGAMPVFEATGLSGKPGLRFTNASGQYLDIGSGALGLTNSISGATLIMVMRRVGTGLNQSQFFISTGASATTARFYWRVNGTQVRTGSYRRLDADVTSTGGTFGNSTTAPEIVSISADYVAGTVSEYVNGALSGTAAPASSGNTSATDSLAMQIGNIASGSSNANNGYLSGILFWPRILSASELQQVHRYLSKKWAISLAA